MAIDYDIVVQGNSLRLPEGFIGLANLSLIRAPAGPLLFDVGQPRTATASLTASPGMASRRPTVPVPWKKGASR